MQQVERVGFAFLVTQLWERLMLGEVTGSYVGLTVSRKLKEKKQHAVISNYDKTCIEIKTTILFNFVYIYIIYIISTPD